MGQADAGRRSASPLVQGGAERADRLLRPRPGRGTASRSTRWHLACAATDLNVTAAAGDGDPAEAAAGAVRLAPLPDDGPSGEFFSWDGTPVPW
jgi:hypothetical protein